MTGENIKRPSPHILSLSLLAFYILDFQCLEFTRIIMITAFIWVCVYVFKLTCKYDKRIWLTELNVSVKTVSTKQDQ